MKLKQKTNKPAIFNIAFFKPFAIIIILLIFFSFNEQVSAQEVNNQTEKQITESKDTIEDEPIYQYVVKMPSFPDEDKALKKFFSKHIKYPEEARKKGISGTVYISFVVGKDGAVSNVKLIRGIGGGCDEEAIRVVSLLPNFDPGLDEKDKPVRAVFNLPISFNLDSGKEKTGKEVPSEKAPSPPNKK